MTNDSLLKALGERAREEEAETIDPELLRPLDADVKARIAQRVARTMPPRRARRSPRWAFPVLLSFAAAAAGILFVLPRTLQATAVPAYSLQASGAKSVRGENADAQEPLRVAEGARVELVLRPARPVEGDVQLSLFVMGDGGRQRLEGDIQRSPQGAFRARITPSSLAALPKGSYSLVAVVSAEAEAPEGPEALPEKGSSRAGWQVFWRDLAWE